MRVLLPNPGRVERQKQDGVRSSLFLTFSRWLAKGNSENTEKYKEEKKRPLISPCGEFQILHSCVCVCMGVYVLMM